MLLKLKHNSSTSNFCVHCVSLTCFVLVEFLRRRKHKLIIFCNFFKFVYYDISKVALQQGFPSSSFFFFKSQHPKERAKN